MDSDAHMAHRSFAFTRIFHHSNYFRLYRMRYRPANMVQCHIVLDPGSRRPVLFPGGAGHINKSPQLEFRGHGSHLTSLIPYANHQDISPPHPPHPPYRSLTTITVRTRSSSMNLRSLEITVAFYTCEPRFHPRIAICQPQMATWACRGYVFQCIVPSVV